MLERHPRFMWDLRAFMYLKMDFVIQYFPFVVVTMRPFLNKTINILNELITGWSGALPDSSNISWTSKILVLGLIHSVYIMDVILANSSQSLNGMKCIQFHSIILAQNFLQF